MTQVMACGADHSPLRLRLRAPLAIGAFDGEWAVLLSLVIYHAVLAIKGCAPLALAAAAGFAP